MSRNAVETVMGGVVLLVAAGFLSFAYKSAGIESGAGGYDVNAEFDNVSGIAVGSDVRIGGVKVGTVTSNALNQQTYRAKLGLHINNGILIPDDSSAAITSDSLLGGKFVSITPGGDDNMLESGKEIKFTQSSVSLEELIGKFVFSGGGVDSKGDGKDKSEPAPTSEGGKL